MLDDTTKHSELMRQMVVKNMQREFDKMESLLQSAVNLARCEHIDEANRILDALTNRPRVPPVQQDTLGSVQGHEYVTEQSYREVQEWLGGVQPNERAHPESIPIDPALTEEQVLPIDIALGVERSPPFAVYVHRSDTASSGTIEIDHDGDVVMSIPGQETLGPDQGEDEQLILHRSPELGPISGTVQVTIPESLWLQLQTHTIVGYPPDNSQEERPIENIEAWERLVPRNVAFLPKRSLFARAVAGHLRQVQQIRRTYMEVIVLVRQPEVERTMVSSTATTVTSTPVIAMESIWVDPTAAVIRTTPESLAHTSFPVSKSALVRLSSEIATIRHAVHNVENNQEAIDRRHSERKARLRGSRDPAQRLLSGGMGSGLRNCINADETWPEGEWGMPYEDPPRQRMELRIRWDLHEPAAEEGTTPQREVR